MRTRSDSERSAATPRAALTALALLVGCATPGPPADLPPDPERCAEVVELHRADPTRPVDEPARPGVVTLPAAGSGTIVVRGVVGEDGRVAPESLDFDGTRDRQVEDRIRRSSPRWSFTPATVDGCRVPATFVYRFTT